MKIILNLVLRRTSFLILLILVAFVTSCQNRRTADIQRLVEEWNLKKVVFPSRPVFTQYVTDTVSCQIPHSDYKIVAFVDSLGCISCKLQLPKWKEFMHEVDSLTGGSVPFLFFFQSKDVRELRYILRRDGFSHPVCIDTEDEFNRLNHFPDKMMFQTFLVDSCNRVKVIGNPIHNFSVRELYIKEIAGVGLQALPVTVVVPDSSAYHYGMVDEGQTVCRKILLRNTGKETFRMKGITTSCDCLTAEYAWNEIQAGETVEMAVSYKAESTGEFWRTLTVYGNVPDKSFTLDFYGTVR